MQSPIAKEILKRHGYALPWVITQISTFFCSSLS
jgi:hypothetical protein